MSILKTRHMYSNITELFTDRSCVSAELLQVSFGVLVPASLIFPMLH